MLLLLQLGDEAFEFVSAFLVRGLELVDEAEARGVGAGADMGAARLLAQLLEFCLQILLQHLVLLFQECGNVTYTYGGSLATAVDRARAKAAAAQPQFVQLPLQRALLLVQTLILFEQIVALLVDLE